MTRNESALPPGILQVIASRLRKVEGTPVRRVLPVRHRPMVGPFLFVDHLGPAWLPPGRGMDVRPHPHINLATITYLFEGELVHRDSTGAEQTIKPGAVNWMLAGRGVVHSERSPDSQRFPITNVEGIQTWIALPRDAEEGEPAFEHHPERHLPIYESNLIRGRVLVGSAYGLESPVTTHSPLFYADLTLKEAAVLSLPEEHEERAIYVAKGKLDVGGRLLGTGDMAVVASGASPQFRPRGTTRVLLLGGAPLDGERHIWWNFVSSRRERIEQAKDDWRNDRFPELTSDADKRVPLPVDPPSPETI